MKRTLLVLSTAIAVLLLAAYAYVELRASEYASEPDHRSLLDDIPDLPRILIKRTLQRPGVASAVIKKLLPRAPIFEPLISGRYAVAYIALQPNAELSIVFQTAVSNGSQLAKTNTYRLNIDAHDPQTTARIILECLAQTSVSLSSDTFSGKITAQNLNELPSNLPYRTDTEVSPYVLVLRHDQ